MTIKLNCAELESLQVGVGVWIGDLEEQEDEGRALEEHLLYRRYHLRALRKRIGIKLAEKKEVTKDFRMQYSEVEIFTLLNCWHEEEDDLLIGILRSIMRKFHALFESQPVRLYVS